MKALIIYTSITKNTEKIARAFEESFRSYGWEVDLQRITNKTERLESDYEKYDVVCLGSPIVAGSPLTCIQKRFSPGGGPCRALRAGKPTEHLPAAAPAGASGPHFPEVPSPLSTPPRACTAVPSPAAPGSSD